MKKVETGELTQDQFFSVTRKKYNVMKLHYEMTIAISTHGISALYSCYNLKLKWGKKCPDKKTDKCYKCKYCKVEMSAADATKCIQAYQRQNAQNKE